ncbi:MAG: EamA family transporter [Bryobacteraceae bacterium]|jgi:drug/metabolite transporter (DMT)-like permease
MNSTPIGSILLVLFGAVVGSFGAVFLKLGAVRLTGLMSLFNWRLAFGVGLYLGSSVFYSMGIRHGQLSVLFPMVAVGYIWTLLWSRLFFHERFTRSKILGLGLVLAGVVLVGLGS